MALRTTLTPITASCVPLFIFYSSQLEAIPYDCFLFGFQSRFSCIYLIQLRGNRKHSLPRLCVRLVLFLHWKFIRLKISVFLVRTVSYGSKIKLEEGVIEEMYRLNNLVSRQTSCSRASYVYESISNITFYFNIITFWIFSFHYFEQIL